jgi:hypothetical protein
MMIIYEITAEVEENLIKSYEKYMREQHIPDLMHTGNFQTAEMAEISAGKYRIRYAAKDQETLDDYIETKAKDLREDFLKHFPDGVKLSREFLKVLQTW